MIDTSKAKSMVTALKYLKRQIGREGIDPKSELASQSNYDASRKDAISMVEGGKMSVNLATIQRTFDEELLAQSQDQLNVSRKQSSSVLYSKPKITDQETFDQEVKRKKLEWRNFMKFMKRNPEAVLGIAEHSTGANATLNNEIKR